MIIISLIIGVLFASSGAESYNVKSPINEESRYKRSLSEDILINLSGISEIKTTSKYSLHEGLKATCKATGENLSYKWAAKIGDLLSNEVAEGNVLTINQVTMKNDREFCCQVSNTVETIEKCKRLGPLVVSSDPLERTIDSSAEMFCDVFGINDHFDIKWERTDGLPLPNNTIINDGRLIFPKLSRTDTGNYTCIGSMNGKTAFHQKISLKVVAPPEIIELRNAGLNGEYNNNVTIQCITQPDETITYTWKTHTDLRENEKAKNDLLSIHNFKKDNEGIFCCVATNALGTREKCMTIKSPIFEVYPKESQEVMAGSSVTLECRESTGSSDMKIDWARGDGQQFTSNVVKLANGNLVIKDIAIDNEGRYDCSATKGVLSTSATTVIKVKTLPVVKISNNDENKIAKLGDKVELSCTADGHPQPNVQWQKFSPETQSYQTVEPATRNSAVYEIKALSEKEVGLYLCLAENSAGSTNKTVQVVIKPLVLEVYPKELDTVMSGSSFTLECRESAKYLNVKIDWTREDGQAFPPNFVKLANGSLRITNITTNNSGRYKCSATKEMLSSSATAVINVKLSPPSEMKIETRFNDDFNYQFICHATGEKISYHWTAQNRKLLRNELAEENKLAFVAAYEGNDATFCCEASNAGGKFTKCTSLPTTVLYPESYSCNAGETIDIPCEVFGQDSSEIYVQWFRGNSTISEKSLGATTATLSNLATGKDDIYYCQGHSRNGTKIFQATTQISVKSSFWCRIFNCVNCQELRPDTSHIWFADREYHK